MFYNIIMVMLILRVRAIKVLSLKVLQSEVNVTPGYVAATVVRDAKVSLLSFGDVYIVMAPQKIMGVSMCAAMGKMRRARSRRFGYGCR